jgi:hypothetical protein
MNGHFRHRNPNESEYEEIGPPKHRAGEYFSIRLTSKKFKQFFTLFILLVSHSI